MLEIGILFEVSLGMSPKPGQKLLMLSNLTTANHPSAFDATSVLCHQGRLEEIRCDGRLLSVF